MDQAFQDSLEAFSKVKMRKGIPSEFPDNSLVFVGVKQFKDFAEKNKVYFPKEDAIADKATLQAMKYQYGQRSPVVKVRDGVYATHCSKIKSGESIGTEDGYFIEPLE